MSGKETGEATRRSVLRGAAGGAAATLSLSAVGAAGAAEDEDIGGWLSDTSNYEGTIQDLRGNAAVRIEVGVGQGFLFGPPAVRIDPGTKVVWEWTGKGGQHNVHAIEGASFKSELKSETGATYSQTVESAGIIEYQCDPHAMIGMKGVLVVGDVEVDVGDSQAPGGGAPAFRLPGGDPGVAIVLAVLGITGAAALSVLASEFRDAFTIEGGAEPEPMEESIVREIGHEEFSPTGTASLIAIYFLILVGLWFFMYFVEFLGNGPTILG